MVAVVLSSTRRRTRRRRESPLAIAFGRRGRGLEGFDVPLLYYDRAAQVGISGAPRLNIGGGFVHLRAASRAPPHRRPRVQRRTFALKKWNRPLCFVCCVRAVEPLTKMKERLHV